MLPVIIEAAALYINMNDKIELLRQQLDYAAERTISAQLELAESGEEAPSFDLMYWGARYTELLEEIEEIENL